MTPTQRDIFPVLDLGLQVGDLTLQLLRTLHSLRTRLTGGQRVASSFDSDGVAWVCDNGGEGLVPSLGGDTRGEGVAAVALMG